MDEKTARNRLIELRSTLTPDSYIQNFVDDILLGDSGLCEVTDHMVLGWKLVAEESIALEDVWDDVKAAETLLDAWAAKRKASWMPEPKNTWGEGGD